METGTKRKLVAAAVAGLAVAGGGAAIAATQLGSPKEVSQAIVNDAAQQLGVQPSQLSDALKKAEENQIDAAVAAGNLSKTEGDQLKAQIEAGNIPLVGVPFFGHFGRGGPGPGPMAGPFGGLDDAATYIGITESQLQTELQSGKTLAEIATAHGKTVDGLIQALVDAAKKHLDEAVTAGKITQSQEDMILSQLKQHITDFVNGKLPTGPMGPMGAPGTFRGPAFHGRMPSFGPQAGAFGSPSA